MDIVRTLQSGGGFFEPLPLSDGEWLHHRYQFGYFTTVGCCQCPSVWGICVYATCQNVSLELQALQ
jgi:hypothetical protein